MCLIIFQSKPHVRVKRKQLYNAYCNNPDGCGIAAIEDGTLKIWKGMPNFRSFYALYKQVCDLPSPVLVHFRVGTQGDNNIQNCHPFGIYPDICFAHNGILQMPFDEDKSDTHLYNEKILQRIPREAYNNEGVWWLMSLGANKGVMVFLTSKGNWRIIGEGKGHWSSDKSTFFSNTSYLQDNNYLPIQDQGKDCVECGIKLKRMPEDMLYVPLCDTCIQGKDN